MQRVAQFEKVSPSRFIEDWMDTFGGVPVRPRRFTVALCCPGVPPQVPAGYDFFAPAPFTLGPGESIKIPTGIRVRMEQGWVLSCYPRSGLGFRYRLQLNNTVGIIDSDYYDSDNEGHIFCKLTNDTREGKTLRLAAGEGYMQGIFLPFGITQDDEATQKRNGGFGSTNQRG